MATSIISNSETMQVKLLRSMYVRGEYNASGTVVTVGKRDGREMIYQERAVPFVAQAEPVAQAPAAVGVDVQADRITISGPADGVTPKPAPIPSASSDESVGGAQPSDSAPAPSLPAAGGETAPTPVADNAAATAPARRTRTRKTESAPAPAAE